jgi:hypothetical protein
MIGWGRAFTFGKTTPRGALEWAEQKATRGDYEEPFVIGAVIDLGNCLDLSARDNIELVRSAAASFEQVQTMANLPMPKNSKAPRDNSPDLVMRYLDCAVMNHLHSIIAARPVKGISPFDTVRALFGEGIPLYEGSGFRDKTHTQIAVRTTDCIKGLFLPIS